MVSDNWKLLAVPLARPWAVVKAVVLEADAKSAPRRERPKRTWRPGVAVAILFIAAVGAGGSQAFRGWFPSDEAAPLKPAEREPMRAVERDGARWLEQPALGIAMRHPGPSFHEAPSLPADMAAALKAEARPFVDLFVFEDGAVSRLTVTITKWESPAAPARFLPSDMAKLARGMEAQAAQLKIPFRTDVNDVVDGPGGKVGRYDVVLGGGLEHRHIRVVPFAHGGAGFTAMIAATSGAPPPALLEAVDSFIARP
jgi:hypothetical protein